VTIADGTSRGKDKLKGELEIARKRIWMARFIGWPALVESWTQTLEKLNDNEARLDEAAFEGMDEPTGRVEVLRLP
jgi:hypothetical protein